MGILWAVSNTHDQVRPVVNYLYNAVCHCLNCNIFSTIDKTLGFCEDHLVACLVWLGSCLHPWGLALIMWGPAWFGWGLAWILGVLP